MDDGEDGPAPHQHDLQDSQVGRRHASFVLLLPYTDHMAKNNAHTNESVLKTLIWQLITVKFKEI